MINAVTSDWGSLLWAEKSLFGTLPRVARYLGMLLPLLAIIRLAVWQSNPHDDCGYQTDDDDKLC